MSKLTNEIYSSIMRTKSKIDTIKLVDLSLNDTPEEIAVLLKVHQLLTEAAELVAVQSNESTFLVCIPRHNSFTGSYNTETCLLPVPTADLIQLAHNSKIRAIKAYRERHQVGVVEAKYAIEQELDNQRLAAAGLRTVSPD